MEDQVDTKLAIQDVLLLASPEGNLSFSVYRKATHTDHYQKFASHQTLEHKLGVIHTLRHRVNTTVSNDEEKIKENQHLRKVLSLAGYPKWSHDKYSGKTKSRRGCMQLCYLLSQMLNWHDHFPKFVCRIIQNFKICEQNHQTFVCRIIKIIIFG